MYFTGLIFTKPKISHRNNPGTLYIIPIFTQTGQETWKVREDIHSHLQGCLWAGF